MPLEISRNDIRNIRADIIVNPTDRFLSGSGSIDKALHKMAGAELERELSRYGRIEKGEAIITDAYDCRNCRYIIHTCGPAYIDGTHDETEYLRSCYVKSLELAKEKEAESIAFPLIAAGTFGFPKGQALRIATDVISGFLLENEMQVLLLVYDKESFDTAGRLYADIRDYLKENEKAKVRPNSHYAPKRKEAAGNIIYEMSVRDDELMGIQALPRFEPDESFSECLIRMIDERGLLDPEVYKKANIDRKHFNHIKNDKGYRPKKETVVALAIGMKLDLQEAAVLLERAGFVLSRSSKFDLIIRYCLENQIYDIYRINEILFAEDQKTLGC